MGLGKGSGQHLGTQLEQRVQLRPSPQTSRGQMAADPTALQRGAWHCWVRVPGSPLGRLQVPWVPEPLSHRVPRVLRGTRALHRRCQHFTTLRPPGIHRPIVPLGAPFTQACLAGSTLLCRKR